MKVLLAFPQKDKQTGLFIRRALQRLGCRLCIVDAKLRPKKILSATEVFNPDLIFCSRTPDLAGPIEKIRERFPSVKVMCWNVDKKNDVRRFEPKLWKLFRNSHILYTIAKGNVKQYSELLPETKVIHLQQGCDPMTHRTEELTEEDHKRFDCDVMFAGSIVSCGGDYVGKQRRRLAQAVKDAGFKFNWYGSNKDNKIWDSEHNKACQCAKIVLGHNGWADVAISMSVRDYKVMGAGGFLLTEHCPEIDKWFPVGKVMDTYKSPQDCVEKIKYYLENEEQRKEMALKSQELVYDKHKYLDRMTQVLEDYKKI